jgi:hypothetical protein
VCNDLYLLNDYCEECFSECVRNVCYYIDRDLPIQVDLLIDYYFSIDKEPYMELFYDYAILTSSKNTLDYFVSNIPDDRVMSGFLLYSTLNNDLSTVKYLIEKILRMSEGVEFLIMFNQMIQNLELQEYIDFRINKY